MATRQISPAARQMRRAMKERGLSFRRLADAIGGGAHFTRLNRIAAGQVDPDLELALSLEALLGIAVEEWPSLRRPVARLLELRGAA